MTAFLRRGVGAGLAIACVFSSLPVCAQDQAASDAQVEGVEAGDEGSEQGPGLTDPDAAADPEATSEARSYFLRALRRADRGQWGNAAQRLRASMRLRPSAHVRYDLAVALYHLNKFDEADELLEAVISDRAASDELKRFAGDLRRLLAERAGQLTIRVSGPSNSATVTLDGRPLLRDRLGIAMPVSPGRHEVVATSHGHRTREQVEVALGGSESVHLSLPGSAAAGEQMDEASGGLARTDASEQDEQSGGGSVFGSWEFWAIVGGAAAAVAVTVVVIVAVGGAGVEDPVLGDANPTTIRWQ